MKKLLFILSFLICAYVSNGQTLVPVGTIFSPNAPTSSYKVGSIKADSIVVIPARDTNFIARYAGSLVFWANAAGDTSVWAATGAYTGRKWLKVVTLSGGGTGMGTVSSVATNNGTGITGGTITGAGTLAIDTLNIIAPKAWATLDHILSVQNYSDRSARLGALSIAPLDITNDRLLDVGGLITTSTNIINYGGNFSNPKSTFVSGVGSKSVAVKVGIESTVGTGLDSGMALEIGRTNVQGGSFVTNRFAIFQREILDRIHLNSSSIVMPNLPSFPSGGTYAVFNGVGELDTRTAAQVRTDIGAGTGSGTVTAFSFTNNTFITGTTTTPTTTPQLALTLTSNASYITGVGTLNGVTVTGVANATVFSGSGALLTNVITTFQGTAGQISTTGTQNIVASLADVNATTGTFNTVTLNSKGQATSATNTAYLTGNQTITFTASGDVTASITGTTALAPVFTLTTVLATAGTFGSATRIPVITTDAKGRITGITSVTPSVNGTLTSISLNPANGVTINTNGLNTTFSATIGLGDITPSSVAASGSISGTLLDLAQQNNPIYSPWRMVADPANAAFTMFVGDPNVGLQVGQEEWIWVKNISGSTITNGSVVYLSGASGGLPTIGLAQANASSTTIGAGIATEDIANNATGYVTCLGTIHQLNTSGFAAGSIVFVSATTPGALTTTAPIAPNYRYRVGIVGVSSASTGTIHVTPSTAALGNGTANQLFGMNTIGTAQEVKTIAGDPNITVTGGVGAITITLNSSISVINFTSTGTTTLATATVSTLTVGTLTVSGSISGVITAVNGTANQITSTQVGSVVTLTLPQNISTASAVQFSTVTIPNTGVIVVFSTTQGTTARADIKNLSVTANENIAGNLIVGGTINATGTITGTLATAAQPNITSVGTLTAVTTTGTITAVGLSVVNATFTAMTVTNTAAMSVVTISNTLNARAITVTTTISAAAVSSTTALFNTATVSGTAINGNLSVVNNTSLAGTLAVSNTAIFSSQVNFNGLAIGTGAFKTAMGVGVPHYILGNTSAANRGYFQLANTESGSNTGSDLQFYRVSDASANTLVYTINRATGETYYSGKLVAGGTTSISSPYMIEAQEGSSGFPFLAYSTLGTGSLGTFFTTATTGDNGFLRFLTDGGSVRGSITYNRVGGLTAYNTTSDRRAKRLFQPIYDPFKIIKKLKPQTFYMKGGSIRVGGFMADELQTVLPEAVTGKKNAVDGDGKPIMQQADYTKVIPYLTAAIQKLIEKSEKQDAEIMLLKNKLKAKK